jgi:hypothetical protein
MFEHRLGLALHKTVAEIRAMPYAEFKRWQIYYLLEPFGWHDEEYRTAIALTMFHNANRGKGKSKKVKDFYRDMPSDILSHFQDTPRELDGMSYEQQREFIAAQIKKDFGI